MIAKNKYMGYNKDNIYAGGNPGKEENYVSKRKSL